MNDKASRDDTANETGYRVVLVGKTELIIMTITVVNFNGDYFPVEEIARVPNVLTLSFDAQSLWAVGHPNGRWWGFKKLLGAEQHRLEMQYWNKHGHGKFCRLPDDIYFADNRNNPNLGELIDDSHKKYGLLPKWPIKFVADKIQAIQ